MQVIYWSYKHFASDEIEEDHPNIGKHCVIAMLPDPDSTLVQCFTIGEEGSASMAFDTKEEAILFVNELNKPAYVNRWLNSEGSYKLEFLENDEPIWKEYISNWHNTVDAITAVFNKLDEYKAAPWYKQFPIRAKIFITNLKNILKREPC